MCKSNLPNEVYNFPDSQSILFVNACVLCALCVDVKNIMSPIHQSIIFKRVGVKFKSVLIFNARCSYIDTMYYVYINSPNNGS